MRPSRCLCVCVLPPVRMKAGIAELEEAAVARQMPGKHLSRGNKYA
jgi:hypothetical protein